MPRVHRQLDEWVEIAYPQRWVTGTGTGQWVATNTATYTWTASTASMVWYGDNDWRLPMGANARTAMSAAEMAERTAMFAADRQAQEAAWEAGRPAREAAAAAEAQRREEWRAGQAERDREYARREAERSARREAANARAEELLLEILDEAQQATYREHGYIEVIGSRGSRYRIRTGGAISGNVDLMHGPEGDLRVSAYCAHGPGHMPSNDHYIQQILALETDEPGFRRVANHYATYDDVPREPVRPMMNGVPMDEAFGWRDLGYVDEAVIQLAPAPRRQRPPLREQREAELRAQAQAYTQTPLAVNALVQRRHEDAAENARNAPPPPGEGDDGALVDLADLPGAGAIVAAVGRLLRGPVMAGGP